MKPTKNLQQILSCRAERNRSVAIDLVNLFNAKIGGLAHFPFIARERSALASGLRNLVASNYVIFYRVQGDDVAIIRGLDGRRDIDAEFER
jgi:plasmid stabilization system protein ParE